MKHTVFCLPGRLLDRRAFSANGANHQLTRKGRIVCATTRSNAKIKKSHTKWHIKKCTQQKDNLFLVAALPHLPYFKCNTFPAHSQSPIRSLKLYVCQQTLHTTLKNRSIPSVCLLWVRLIYKYTTKCKRWRFKVKRPGTISLSLALILGRDGTCFGRSAVRYFLSPQQCSKMFVNNLIELQHEGFAFNGVVPIDRNGSTESGRNILTQFTCT